MPDTQELNWNAVVLAKLDNLAQENRNVATGIVQLTAESESILKTLARVEGIIDRLEVRDNELQTGINTLTMNQHRTDAAVAVVANDTRTALQLATKHERECQIVTDNFAQASRRMDEFEIKTGNLDAKIDATEARAEAHRRAWEPWAQVAKWAALIIGGVIVTAIAIWLLRDLAGSIMGGGMP